MQKNSWYRCWLLTGVLCYLLPLMAGAQGQSFLFDLKGGAAKGEYYFIAGNYKAAIPHLQQAVAGEKGERQLGYMEKLACAYVYTGYADEALKLLGKIREQKELEGEQQLWYANALMATGRMEEGRLAMVKYLRMEGRNADITPLLGETTISSLFRDSIRYTVRPVSINTEASEYSPYVVQDGVLFAGAGKGSGLVKRHFTADNSNGHDLYYAPVAKNGDLRKPVLLSGTVNTPMPEGPATTFNSGRQIIFTRATAKGDMELFSGKMAFNLASWVSIEPLQLPVKGAVGHPAVSEDGNILFFVSDMPGGYGGTDIYRIEKTADGWGEARNLGPGVNTAGNEMFPSLHASGKLYFASNGHYGLGGLDIFEASMEKDSVVAVRNLGAPVNSEGDDFGLSLHESDSWGYFSSNRTGGAGEDDIYRLDVHIIELEGQVLDKTNGKPVAGARLKLQQEDKVLAEAISDKQGKYSFRLYPGQQYSLHLQAADFRDAQELISTREGSRYGVKKWETSLDRKVKMFVLGTIKNRFKREVEGARMMVIDQTNRKITDTVYADHRGNYELELDTKSQYTFWVDCETEGAVLGFSTPEKGKASLSYYENIRLQATNRYKVNGKLQTAESGIKVLSLTNHLTQVQEYLFTDEEGHFSFEAYSLADYELCLQHQDKSVSLMIRGPWAKAERIVELKY